MPRFDHTKYKVECLEKILLEVGLEEQVVEDYVKPWKVFRRREELFENLNEVIIKVKDNYSSSQEFKGDFDKVSNCINSYRSFDLIPGYIMELTNQFTSCNSDLSVFEEVNSIFFPENGELNIGVYNVLNSCLIIGTDTFDPFCSLIKKYNKNDKLSSVLSILYFSSKHIPQFYFQICDVLENQGDDKLIETYISQILVSESYFNDKKQENINNSKLIPDLTTLISNGLDLNKLEVNISDFFENVYYKIKNDQFKENMSHLEVNCLTKTYELIKINKRTSGFSKPDRLFESNFVNLMNEVINSSANLTFQKENLFNWSHGINELVKDNHKVSEFIFFHEQNMDYNLFDDDKSHSFNPLNFSRKDIVRFVEFYHLFRRNALLKDDLKNPFFKLINKTLNHSNDRRVKKNSCNSLINYAYTSSSKDVDKDKFIFLYEPDIDFGSVIFSKKKMFNYLGLSKREIKSLVELYSKCNPYSNKSYNEKFSSLFFGLLNKTLSFVQTKSRLKKQLNYFVYNLTKYVDDEGVYSFIFNYEPKINYNLPAPKNELYFNQLNLSKEEMINFAKVLSGCYINYFSKKYSRTRNYHSEFMGSFFEHLNEYLSLESSIIGKRNNLNNFVNQLGRSVYSSSEMEEFVLYHEPQIKYGLSLQNNSNLFNRLNLSNENVKRFVNTYNLCNNLVKGNSFRYFDKFDEVFFEYLNESITSADDVNGKRNNFNSFINDISKLLKENPSFLDVYFSSVGGKG